MSKRVIVSGATGQDGSYMIEYLLANTTNMIIAAIRRTSQAILTNLKGVLDNPRVKLVTLDLNDVHSITYLIRDEKPDYFINFGASAFVPDSWNSPAQVLQTNAVSLVHILEAVRQYAPLCRVYSAGSSEQWGNVLYSPQDENHPPRPRSVYGVSKVAAGMICKVYRESYGIYAVHGVLLNHESERRQAYYVTRKITLGVARIAKAIKAGKSFEPIELGNIDAKRDWSHASCFVEGIWRILNQDIYRTDKETRWQHPLIENQDNPNVAEEVERVNRGFISWLREYVLASDETHSIREFIEKAFDAAGIMGDWYGSGLDETYRTYIADSYVKDIVLNSSALVKINPAFYRPADVELLWGTAQKARTELGWQPKVSFDELVKRMVESDLASS